MIYKNEYVEALPEWDAFYSSFLEKAEDCYLRWINQDEELTDAEKKLAVEYQQMIEDEGDTIEIFIPPEHELSPDELDCLLRIANKLQRSGILSIINAMLGTTDSTHLRFDCLKGKGTS